MSECRFFFLDENIDPKTATYLQKEGVHTEHVRDALWQVRTTKQTSCRMHWTRTSLP